MSKKKKNYIQRIQNLGFMNFLNYTFHKKTNFPSSGEFLLGSKFAGEPLICRGGTSDIDVFKHIYVLREYSFLEGMADLKLIIDCGANAGFSTSYLLERFPNSKVMAVEPDPGNFEMLRKNTERFGDRCAAIQAGIWSKTCELKLAKSPMGDGREWAISVREIEEGETSDVNAIDIGSVIEKSGHNRVSLLKIDIEGSELQVFGDLSYKTWIDLVDNIIIELHGEQCTETYLNAVDGAGFKSHTTGGLVFSTRNPSLHKAS